MALPLGRGGFFYCSPSKTEDKSEIYCDKENNSLTLPVLSLTQFSRAPFLTFGTVKLGSSKSAILRIENPVSDNAATNVTVSKIASSKGFFVDQTNFKIQSGEVYDLTITWTPIEEGGVRELIIFFANGVVKHQAVLLGRAEAPKKKKKSLWDSIKNKRSADFSVTSKGNKKTEAHMKKAACKTLHMSRNPQYEGERVQSSLASLNDVVAVKVKSLSRCCPDDDHSEQQQICTPVYKERSQEPLDQVNVDNNHTTSPMVLIVPSLKTIDPSKTSDGLGGPVETVECRDIVRILNKTLSPVGTPDRLKNLMPHIDSLLGHVNSLPEVSNRAMHGICAPSVKDALSIIDSDLSTDVTASSPKACSSSDFSDSLESEMSNMGGGPDEAILKGLAYSPNESEPAQPRLTFFVKSKLRVGPVEDLVAPRIEVEGDIHQVKKVPFTSATVIKSKAAPAPREGHLAERKTKTSRRRLLEKTLEIPDRGSYSDSSVGSPGLPVIDSDISSDRQHNGSITMPPLEAMDLASVGLTPNNRLVPVTFSLSPPLLRAPFILQHHTENKTTCVASLPELVSAHCPVQPGVFPVHSQSQFDVIRSKKRKSDEFLRDVDKVEDTEKMVEKKRSRVSTLVKEPVKPAHDARKSALQRPQRTAFSLRSISASSHKVKRSTPAQTKQQSLRAALQGTSLKSFGTSSLKTAKVVAVAQSTLTFIKPGQSAIPRHPMPFVAKNMFYDERWIEKQERGFTWWINYILTPDDFKVNTEVTQVNAVSLAMGSDDKCSVPKAPTKEEMSFSTYTARRRLNRLRRSACHLFTSEAMVKAIQRLELEVEAKRLLVRKDRHLWKDIGERQKVLNWLLSYNPLWLRIGLETIYGELISLESNSDVMGLAMFILRRLLWNPDIAAEFRHAKVPNLYKDGHEEALSRFTLKKLLLLVCFLDKAKESRMIEHDPCLFCMDAEFKTSKDLLLAFSRDFLSGEGILPRHLGYLGLPVSHMQTPLDEFNFAVKNLAVDLKCGIRLVRVMELFTQDWSLSQKLRMPAISRLQKVHNVDIALQLLKAKGVDLQDENGVISSRDIVDGHREKTLTLLWKIIFLFQVEVLLNEEQLRVEINYLKRTWSTKQKLASLKANKVVSQKSSTLRSLWKHCSQKISLLMDWVNAVCQFYNVKVENFTVSFSDGRALCYLIHHYHPSHLPDESICQSTTQTVECSQRGRVELNCSSSDSDTSFDTWPTTQNFPESPTLEFKELLENEKNNFKLVNTAVSFLGGVPAMINAADMSNTIPNEKVVMSYLSFLCARLLDLRNETRAARVIQEAWRKYRLRKDQELYQERNAAAGKIQVHVRRFLQRRRTKKQNCAAVSIQAAWRAYKARNAMTLMRKAKLRALKITAATAIQAQWRRYIAMKSYQSVRSQVIVLQALWRMKRAVSAYSRILWAAIVIQRHTRARTMGRIEREKYLSLKSAVVKVQRSYRRWTTKSLHRKNHAASVIQTTFRKWRKDKMARRSASALKIQSWFRMRKCLNHFVSIRQSAILIQKWYKGQVERRNFLLWERQNHSATIIQSAFRASVVRRRMEQMRHASVIIQRRFKASLLRDAERQKFLAMKCAAITLQSVYRGNMGRKTMKERHRAATVIQTSFRKFMAHWRFNTLKRVVITLQQQYRAILLGRSSRMNFVNLRCSVLKIQAVWRGRAIRKKIEKLHKCATVLQANYRRHAIQSKYRLRKLAALVIQHRFRALLAGNEIRAEYLQVKKAVITLQAGVRGMRTRKEFREKHQAATVIQSLVRGFISKRHYSLMQSAAIILQSRYRAHLVCKAQQQQYSQLKQATLKVQAAYRESRVRRDLRKRHKAATVIQAQFKMHKVRVSYLATKCASIIVQEHYRANKLRDQQVQLYQSIKSSALRIQAVYRGHRVRLAVAEMHKNAIIIQRWFLTCMVRKRFLAIKAAVSQCQQRYRAFAMGRKERKNYYLKRRAVITLQATYRGMRVRQQLLTECTAAITIQSYVRMHLIRTRYKRLLWAVNKVQAQFRSNKQMEKEMQSLDAKKKAVIVLQSAFRGIKTRGTLKEMHKAALLIQRCYRAHLERKQYHALRSSALVVQKRYRASMEMKQQRQHYQRMQSAAVLLQAIYRSQHVRRQIVLQHQAATLIQAAFRRHREEIKFQAMRLSAIILQRHIRSCIQMNRDRQRFLKLRNSAMVIQTALRGCLVRREITKMHIAATVIQTHFRMQRQHCAFRRQCWAAVVLQQRFKAQRKRNAQLKEYQQMRGAVVMLQAAFRGMRSRQGVQHRHKAAGVIQRCYKAHLEHKQYLSLRSSVLVVQQRYRATMEMKQQRQHYQLMQNAAVLLQATYRGQQVRRKIMLQHQAATLIQAAFRRHREEIKFQAMRLSAVILQRHIRSCIQMNQDRHRFLKLRDSAIIIQTAFRGCLVRRDVAKMHRAATVIQAHFRMQRQHCAFRRQRWAAVILQQRFRARRDRDAQVERYQQIRGAVTCIQASFKGMRARALAKRIRAAKKIQSFLKMSLRRQWFLKERAAAVVIQSAFKGHKAREHYTKMQASVVTIQKWYRSCKLTHKVRLEYMAIRGAAVKIQSVLRMALQRTRYSILRSSTVRLQSHCKKWIAQRSFLRYRQAALTLQRRYRGLRAQREQRTLYLKTWRSVQRLQARVRGHLVLRRYQRLKKSAVIIQAFYRGMVERQNLKRQRVAVFVIQEHYRAHLLRQREQAEYLAMKQSAVFIQSWFRGHQTRRWFLKRQDAVAIVHRCLKTKLLRKKFVAIQHSALVIQHRWRETSRAKEEHQYFLSMKASAVVIQATWRGHRARQNLLLEQKAALRIQSFYRGYVQRQTYQRQRKAVFGLQKRFRAIQQARLEREKFSRMRDSAITLQKHFRCWIARRRLQATAKAGRRQRFLAAVFHHLCAMRIQRAVRAHWALQSAKRQIHSVITIQRWVRARQQRQHYLKQRRMVITAQRAVRWWLACRHQAASVIQHTAKRFLLLRRQQRVEQGIIKAQALCRGHASRKLNDYRKVVAIRHRLRKVSEDVQEADRLCNKTSTAIDYLLRYKHFSYILEALKNLEIATRLSPECCEMLVKSGATLVIFTLIRSCNRSVPCMEVITSAIQVLLNLSKYHKTIEAVYAVENSVDTLLDLLQIYREKAGDKVADKGGSIFTKACFLLAVLLQDQYRALEVRKIPKAVDRIQSIYRLTVRKNKMDVERSVIKQKMNASINSSFLSATTPRKFRPMYKFTPDWVLKKDKMKDIVDPLRAIQMVADAFATAL